MVVSKFVLEPFDFDSYVDGGNQVWHPGGVNCTDKAEAAAVGFSRGMGLSPGWMVAGGVYLMSLCANIKKYTAHCKYICTSLKLDFVAPYFRLPRAHLNNWT